MPSTSNDHGRAFECILVKDITQTFPLISQTSNCLRCQHRDEEKISELDITLKEDMLRGSHVITNWLTHLLSKNESYIIDRLDDNVAMEGDVTDICIHKATEDEKYNLSVKHNHNATKHQRIPALMQAMGFEKGSSQDLEYRREYEEIKADILANIHDRFPHATLFRQIKSQDNTYIDQNIYSRLCSFYRDSIIRYSNNSTIQNLFKFLVGNVGFYKFINFPGYVEIMNFTEIELPSTCNIVLRNNSHIGIEFNNGFTLDMRLHSASSRFSGLSLKFDTQIESLPEDFEKIIISKQ